MKRGRGGGTSRLGRRRRLRPTPSHVDFAGYKKVLTRCAVVDYVACCNTLPGQLQFMKAAGMMHEGQGVCDQLGKLAASDVGRRHVMVAAAM